MLTIIYVYSCLLDASKAFDRVHLGTLFSILLNKDIPITVVRLYFDSYSRQQPRVGWKNIMSEYLSVSNGVKQGGVLSSMLFSLYIHPVLLKLEQSSVGCHINGNFMGVLSYADDITLICPSIWGLNEMLKICNPFSKNNSILFKKKKTTCIKFGDIIRNGENVFLDGSELVWKDSLHILAILEILHVMMILIVMLKICSLLLILTR